MAHIVSLPINGGGQPKFLHSDDPAVIARWIEAENRPGYGIYDILNPLVPGARTQGKENMRGVLFLFVDVDCKDVVEPSAEVERHLRNLALKPTWLNDSGHGFHVIYQLKEEIERGIPEFDRAQAFQEQLIHYLAGDPKVRLWSLLRRPGTTNFKEEPFVQCHTVLTGVPVDFTEMEAFCELVAGAALLTPKADPGPGNDGEAALKASVDVEQRLADMRWHGAGNSSIDITRNDVMASLLNSGMCLTEATDIILAAIRTCVAGDPAAAPWDWHAEYLRTAYNGATLINKDHTLVHLLPDDLRTKFQEMGQNGLGPVIKKNAYKLFVYPTAPPASGKKATSAPSSKPGTSAYIRQDNKKVLTLRPFVPIDEASLPTRAWLYGKHYQRGTVSLTAGPGGMGKSSLDMVEAVAMATGCNLLGEQPEEMLRVWYHNGDDPQDELDRRLVAICKHYRIPQAELSNRLWTTSAQEFPLKVAKGYANLEIDGNLVRQISEVIAGNRIDVAIFDPLVSLHSVSEMDTGKMDAVIRLFAGIGGENNASIDLAHHVRKLPPGATADYEVQDIRGVTAITDAVRAARVLNRMSEKDAEVSRL